MNNLPFRIKPVKGGIYIQNQKQLVLQQTIEQITTPNQLFFPLTDQRGQLRVPVLDNATEVLKGQQIAAPISSQSVPIHASSAGILHYSDAQNPEVLIIEANHKNQTVEFSPILNPLQTPPDELIEKVENAGVTGMGGAGFPAHLKLRAALKKQPQTLIINAVECDPFTTCDSALLMSRLDNVLDGAAFIMHICKARHCIISIEDQQLELLKQLSVRTAQRTDFDFEIIAVPSKYPSGSEQQLVQTVTGRTLQTGQTALHVGVICYNIATIVAIYDAIKYGQPLIERIVTLSGPAVLEPKNYQLAIGTSINAFLTNCGIANQNITTVTGGVMMGQTISAANNPILKETYSVWVSHSQTNHSQPQPCIRCGECAYVCPTSLQPQSLYRLAESKHWNQIEQDNTLSSCIECGACDLVCPSHIPLTETFITAKQQLLSMDQAKKKAQHAQMRYQARQERLAKLATQKQQSTRKRKKPDDVKNMLERIKNKIENDNQ